MRATLIRFMLVFTLAIYATQTVVTNPAPTFSPKAEGEVFYGLR